MSYLEAIFENKEMNEYVNGIEESVSTFVNENINDLFMENFKYVAENINQFFGKDLLDTYNNIKEFVCADTTILLNAVGEAYSMDDNFEYVSQVMEDEISPVFTGFGYGAQKAHQIIEGLYEEECDIEGSD